MLVSMNDMLAAAKAGHYAIPAFDVSNYEMMKAVLDICEEERSPALLMCLECDLRNNGMPLLAEMIRGASRHYSVPVCLHLDHATDLALIKAAADAGFTSVMYDGSVLPFAENARSTAEVTAFAHKRGISVEAELGHVGNGLVGNGAAPNSEGDAEETLTVPEEVARFLSLTHADALAVAIGTSHGIYRKTPSLRIDRLDAITAVCDCPLVLHGGSGTPADQIQTAIAHGVTKINIYSDVVAAMNRGLLKELTAMDNPAAWPVQVFSDARRQMREVIREKVRAFGSANRV